MPPQIESDPVAILTALSGLLSNAIRNTRQGSVTVRVTRAFERNQLRVEVTDTGVGIAWQAQPRLDQVLTESAGQDPAAVEGGLRRSAAIAARLGGELGFESQPGCGSHFWFTANYAAPHNTQLETPAPALPRQTTTAEPTKPFASSVARRP